jgi:mannose-6-phosphate isomerase-like protein (cupin superfamily)
MIVEQREKMRGGDGIVTLTHLAPSETFCHAKMMAEIRIPPGGSIGYHKHEADIEYFFFMSGKGIVNDNGVELPVAAGDTVVTGNGSSHGVANAGKDDLVFHAVILA